jgi:hypothetical protein
MLVSERMAGFHQGWWISTTWVNFLRARFAFRLGFVGDTNL